jgi:hypothetical protein
VSVSAARSGDEEVILVMLLTRSYWTRVVEAILRSVGKESDTA